MSDYRYTPRIDGDGYRWAESIGIEDVNVGTLDGSLQPLGGSFTGDVVQQVNEGTLAGSLQPLGGDFTGSVVSPNDGQLDGALQPLGGSFTGSVLTGINFGELAGSLQPLGGDFVGRVSTTITGTLEGSLQPLGFSATGVVTTPAPEGTAFALDGTPIFVQGMDEDPYEVPQVLRMFAGNTRTATPTVRGGNRGRLRAWTVTTSPRYTEAELRALGAYLRTPGSKWAEGVFVGDPCEVYTGEVRYITQEVVGIVGLQFRVSRRYP